MKFRKKPVVIEAMKAADAIAAGKSNWRELPQWFRDHYEAGNALLLADQVNLVTLEGTMIARPDDWIICGVKGEVYPCKPDIFEATYEPA